MTQQKTVQAAGGVVWRTAPGGGIRIAVVHRPSYDDWSLPKGKLDDGETLIQCCIREIKEETGFRIRLQQKLVTTKYPLQSGARKVVHYWVGELVGDDTFVPNNEVDRLMWLDPQKAREKVSYKLDRKVIDAFLRFPTTSATMLVVRHAKAGSSERWSGDDDLRPLDTLGQAQAEALVSQCIPFGPNAVFSADRVRCTQTVAPLAAYLGVPITPTPELSEEAYRADPARGLATITSLSAMPADEVCRVVCSQGKVIPPVMNAWSAASSLTLPAARNRKGSMWVLTVDDRSIRMATHISSPLPPGPAPSM